MDTLLTTILLVLLSTFFFGGALENFAGSPATITQLNANSGRRNIRPVRQRGIYFGNPSWHR
jgi:hypothetical protein